MHGVLVAASATGKGAYDRTAGPRSAFPGGSLVTNVQARLISSGLALVAGAILFAAHPQEPFLSTGVLIIAGVLFIVEYVRTQLPNASAVERRES